MQSDPMIRGISLACAVVLAIAGTTLAADIALTRDGQTLTATTKVATGVHRIPDTDNDGAILIKGDDITVDFQGADWTAAPRPGARSYAGTGIVLTGRNITLRNAKVRGYKVGIHRPRLPGPGDRGHRHLRQLPEAPALHARGRGRRRLALRPQQRRARVARRTTARGCTSRTSDRRDRPPRAGPARPERHRPRPRQRVQDLRQRLLVPLRLGPGACGGRNDNVISRNAFDFCVRGYSHGVYNRGQDSAGILMFEQNSDNVIAENSVTHGGDGFFGFAGREALGDDPPPRRLRLQARAATTTTCSSATTSPTPPAHGIEMTFCFGNKFVDNRLVGNAICGIWGGFCQDTLIAGNEFEGNGEMGYGLERGGVNIDHGRDNRIVGNTFKNNKCGVHLWGPPSRGLPGEALGQGQPARPRPTTSSPATPSTATSSSCTCAARTRTSVFADNKLVNVGKEDRTSPTSPS